MIAVLIPTRGRPDGLRATLASLQGATSYVGFDRTDPVPYEGVHGDEAIMFGDDPTSWKWNKLATLAVSHGAEILVIGSDDVVFETRGWTEILRERFAKWPDGIGCVGFADGRSADGTPHIAVTRKWVETLGFFVPPIVHHWGVDTWTVDVAKRAGRFEYAADIMARHRTVKLTGKFDDTHNRIRRGVWLERDLSIIRIERYKDADAAALKAVML